MGKWKILIEQLAEGISRDISNAGDDPLDGDETDRIGKLLTLELDLRQGNLSDKEYQEALADLEY